MVVQLIAKDKNEKIQYEGRCKLEINSISKLLLVEPFVEEFKMISAVFKWEFVAQKNALFVFAEHNFQDFVLIFDNPKKCQKIYDILIDKGATAGESDLPQKRFLPEIFKEISENNLHSSLKLKEIFGSWMKQPGKNKRIKCILQSKGNSMNEVNYPLNEENIRVNPRKRKAKNISYKEVEAENIESARDTNASRHDIFVSRNSTPISTPLFVAAPNFELLKVSFNGCLRTYLYIFTEVDEKKYYYRYSLRRNKLLCYPCYERKNNCTARIIKQDGKEVVQLNGNQHICQPKEFKEIIEMPNFEVVSYDYCGKVFKKYVIFLDSSRTTCYEFAKKKLHKQSYGCCGCRVKKHSYTAKILQRRDGKEIVMTNPGQHVCHARKYNPEKYGVKEIIEDENFNIVKDGNGQIKLIIFTSTEKTSLYEYIWREDRNNFICQRCLYKSKYVSAKVCQNSEGLNYLKLNNMKHVCNPQIYDPEKYEIATGLFNDNGLNLNFNEMLPHEEVSDPTNFRVYHIKQSGESVSRLIVFCTTNKNLCYEFFWNQRNRYYYCRSCPWNNVVKAVVSKNEKNMEYLKIYGEHICDLCEFDEENFKDDMVIDKSDYNITVETLPNGSISKILSLFTSDNEKGYYKYSYDSKKNCFVCRKCEKHKIFNTVIVENEGKEDEFAYVSRQKHVCDGPVVRCSNICTPQHGSKYFIVAQNFKLFKNDRNGKIKDEMVIFTNEEESECYKYIWHETRKCYICQNCYNKFRIYVNARLVKIAENKERVEMCQKVKHKCEPIKYVSVAEKIINLPNFKLWDDNEGNKKTQKLTIFSLNDSKQSYIYSFHKSLNKYECLPCKKKKKSLTAKVLQNENGENYLQVNHTGHVCK